MIKTQDQAAILADFDDRKGLPHPSPKERWSCIPFARRTPSCRKIEKRCLFPTAAENVDNSRASCQA
ncbi:MAG: hypothetical protein C4334_11305 [Pyrinomonas sp.]